MKSAAILLLLIVSVIQMVSCLVDCGTLNRAICDITTGDGRVCGCSSLTHATCTMRNATYSGACDGQVYLDLCDAFCANGGHMCKGGAGSFCNEYEPGEE